MGSEGLLNLKDFGTETQPLRASSLPALLRCPLGVLLTMLSENDSSQAADTGSAIHKAIAAFHTVSKRDVASALKEMRVHLPEYPLADFGTAEEHFRAYTRDPRNQGEVLYVETKIQIVLPPPEGDTQAVVIPGMFDQLREEEDSLILYDVKTGGSHEGDAMLDAHAAQLMAYQVGASRMIGRTVSRAGVIRTKDYLKKDYKRNPKPGPVFWRASWTYHDALLVMNRVRQIVGRVRRGEIDFAPSAENCKWCVGGGISNCLGRVIECGVSSKLGATSLSVCS